MRDRRIAFAALLTGQAVSVTGNRIALLAIPWFVLQTTGSAAQTGVAAAANTVPAIIAGLFAGPLIERAGYRPTSVVADLASGVTIAAIPVLHMADLLTYPLLLALVFAGALLDSPGDTARRALLPDLAEFGGVSIDRAASLHETVYRTTQLLGAPIGGVLIATIGAAQAMLVDAGTFAVSAVLIGALARVPAAVTADTSHSGPATAYLTELRDAWMWLLDHRLMRSVVAVFIAANVLEVGFVQVLLPIVSDRVYGDSVVLGLLVGGIGAGALLGVALHTAVAGRWSRRVILIPAFLFAGAPKFILLAAFPPAAAAVVGILLLSVAMGPVNPISGAIEYELIPKAMRGRIFGLLSVAFMGAAPIGALGAGVSVELIGLRTTLLVGAGLYALTTIVPVLHPAWNDLDDLSSAHGT